MHLRTLLLNALLIALLPISVIHADEVPLGKKYIVFGTVPQSGRINPLHSLATELVSRGHDTTFFTMERGDLTKKEKADKNVQFVSLGNFSAYCSEDEMVHLQSSQMEKMKSSFGGPMGAILFRRHIFANLGKCIVPAYNETIMKMHQSFQQKRPDLCIIDYMSIAHFDACVSLNIPTVIMRPGFLIRAMNYIPPMRSGASIRSTFWQRFSWDLKQHIYQFSLGGTLISIPGFADQFDMAIRLKDAGVAEIITSAFAAPEFASALTTMLHPQNHTSYVLRAKYLSQLLKKAGGKQRAAALMEEIIELGGYEHLIPYSVKHMTYAQRKGLDILAGYIVMALAWAGVTVALGKRIGRWVWRKAKGRTDAKVGSQKKIQTPVIVKFPA
ncbi:hypothetical protein BC937DRAFT_92589 [Endogone sp. FLAS-F59071]|nr:hypothetical protein BC937DRAFT_92589 [Endogone sp. FLAS-F59071]|eukprot:RUS15323.1 hypothetical protein BC937DRAFT_92589 [Endogone sp. FLAS-F59071]